MGPFDKLLQRWLERYGLVLTPEGRVLSTRPVVLDDGYGGKIVGWLDDDLAAMELERWGAPPPPPKAPAKPVAAIDRLQSRPISPPPVKPVVVAAPPPPPAPVAAEPPVEEDEWEWEIAMARARAAAAEVEEAVQLIRPDPRANLIAEVWDDAPALPAPPAVKPRPPAPSHGQRTVIPVPPLVVAVKPSDVRPAPRTPSQPPRRMPRGTGRLEETVRTQAAPPANDDRTRPYLELPSEVKPTGFAHTKRVAAKQR
jgi:hypothetical protein